MPVEHINAATYDTFVSPQGVALIHFWAEWDLCHLAVRLAIELAVEEVDRDIRHGMWNTDDRASSDLVRGLAIANVPTLLFFRDGEAVGIQVGNKSTAVVAHALARICSGERIGRV